MQTFQQFLSEGAAEHEALKDHTKNPYHETLMAHGFVHAGTEHKQNRFAKDNPKADYTEHVYTHPAHGKSHVIVTQEHDATVGHGGRKSKGHSFLHRHEQSNGIMAPASGDSKPQLHRSLSSNYGVPKGMEAPKLTAWERNSPRFAPHYKMNEAILDESKKPISPEIHNAVMKHGFQYVKSANGLHHYSKEGSVPETFVYGKSKHKNGEGKFRWKHSLGDGWAKSPLGTADNIKSYLNRVRSE